MLKEIQRTKKYKEIDRQVKEQFIHRLKDTDMLAKIIMELTKVCKKHRDNK